MLGITGSILAFEMPLDRALNPKLSYISPSARDLPLNQILRSVQVSFPSEGIVAITFAKPLNIAWQVALPSGIAYINPHTGQVLGLRSRGQTFLGIARRLHVSLASGNIGRSTIRWSNLAMLLLLLSGFVLWSRDRRIRLISFDGSRRFWSNLHKAIGVGSFALLLIASGTGAFISFEGPVSQAIRAFEGRNQITPPHLLPPQPRRDTAYTGPDQALSVAQGVLPNYSPSRMQMPAYGGTYKISMIEHHAIRSDVERVVTIDPYSGKVIFVSSDADLSFAQRLFATNEAVHTGSAFGFTGRSLMALASIMVLPQAVSGFIMWWKRVLGKSLHRRKLSAERISI
jgi:sulfite reductase (NADPH) flavoprotein alpha-component